MFKYRKKGAGFSIIELVLSIGIMALVSSVAVASGVQARRLQELRSVGFALVADLRRLQAMSLQGTRLTDGRIPRGGYGIVFDVASASYTLFAERPFTSGGAVPALSSVNGRRDGSAGVDFQDIATQTLPATVTMTIQATNGYADNSITTLAIVPPRAILCAGTAGGLGITSGTAGSPPFEVLLCNGAQPDRITVLLERPLVPARTVIIDRRSGQVSML